MSVRIIKGDVREKSVELRIRVLDLFSGIGGFSLGLERAGMKTVAFCEIDPFCRRVLAKHWPGVPCYDDIRTITAARLAADGIIKVVANAECVRCNGPAPLSRSAGESKDRWRMQKPSRRSVDLICGGFPCQDISVAGKGAGIDGARSGLWSEFARIIGEVRPSYVIVENVAALLGRGLARVLGDLAALGFDAEWHCIPASAVGAPHRRDRVWIIGHAMGNATSARCNWRALGNVGVEEEIALPSAGSEDVANVGITHVERQWFSSGIQPQRSTIGGSSWWQIEPDVGRVAHGVPDRVDRLRSLGNAVVPQVTELIGRAILALSRIKDVSEASGLSLMKYQPTK